MLYAIEYIDYWEHLGARVNAEFKDQPQEKLAEMSITIYGMKTHDCPN